MNIQEENLRSLRDKALRVADKVSSMRSRIEELESEVESIKSLLSQKTSELSVLQAKYDKLKLTNALVNGSEDKHEAELMIKKMLREVDKCIALLNR